MKRGLVAGTINYYPRFGQGWEVVNLDVQDRRLATPGGGSARPDVVADVREMPFADESFDRVQLWDVLEHLDAAGGRRALREIRRVLRPEGILDVQVPNLVVVAQRFSVGELTFEDLLQLVYGQHLGADHGEPDYHRFGYSAASLHEALSDAGYRPGEDLGVGTVVARFEAERP